MILAGDIGGTSTRLALFDEAGDRVVPITMSVMPSASMANLSDAIDHFLERRYGAVDAACFGIAGPVIGGRATLPNLRWTIEHDVLARQLGLRSMGLINDLEANAWGIASLAPDDLVTLNDGASGTSGNAAVISVGTGLGMAGLYWDGEAHHPFATESGHADFSPRDALEVDLLLDLLQQFPRVSAERVLSGAGLYRAHDFLRRRAGLPEPAWLTEAAQRQAGPAAISTAALEGRCDSSVQALRLFVSCLGAEAGNLALRMMAVGGVYVGGGIPPKILPMLRDGTFMAAFVAKGRMQALLETIPVRVIRNDKTALIGAARWAARHGRARREPVPR